MTTQPRASAFSIFYVCTGNQARSPVAAAWTARALAGLPVEVGSAGTLLRPATAALPEAARLASDMGLDLARHSSSHVSAHDLSNVDLVIGFELHHVAAAVVDGGAEVGRTFLLRELVRLLRDTPPPPPGHPAERIRASIRGAHAIRAAQGFVPGQEIDDPAGRRPAEFREILGEVVRSCSDMCRLLFGR